MTSDTLRLWEAAEDDAADDEELPACIAEETPMGPDHWECNPMRCIVRALEVR